MPVASQNVSDAVQPHTQHHRTKRPSLLHAADIFTYIDTCQSGNPNASWNLWNATDWYRLQMIPACDSQDGLWHFCWPSVMPVMLVMVRLLLRRTSKPMAAVWNVRKGCCAQFLVIWLASSAQFFLYVSSSPVRLEQLLPLKTGYQQDYSKACQTWISVVLHGALFEGPRAIWNDIKTWQLLLSASSWCTGLPICLSTLIVKTSIHWLLEWRIVSTSTQQTPHIYGEPKWTRPEWYTLGSAAALRTSTCHLAPCHGFVWLQSFGFFPHVNSLKSAIGFKWSIGLHQLSSYISYIHY